MAEKKEGFGAAPERSGTPPPILFHTPDYQVVIGRLPPADGQPPNSPLLVRYIVQHREHGVMYGTAAGLGQAIAAAVQAQIELGNAQEGAREFASRSYKMEDNSKGGGGLNIPSFQ